MRVEQDYRNVNQSVGKGSNTISHGSTDISRKDRVGAYAVDISGTVMDNKAYGGQGKTTEDVMQQAGQIDVAQQKDYAAVMSNSMSEEDFAKLQEEGYHPGDTDIETMVTVVDRIKAELVKAGVDISGYTDTLDADTLAAITGDEAQARSIAQKLKENDAPVTKENIEALQKALEKATELTELSDGAMKYMIQNHMEPTIDNIYTAEYSATGDGNQQPKGYYADSTPGYYAKKADHIDYTQLDSQIEKRIQEAGFEVNEESKANAKWLIEKGIPFTPEALQQLDALKKIDMSMAKDTEAMGNYIAQSIGEGKKAGDTTFSHQESIYRQAVELMDALGDITEEAVSQVIEKGETINIKNLSQEQKRINISREQEEKTHAEQGKPQIESNAAGSAPEDLSEKTYKTQKQLAEIRLQMTMEANVKLLKAGIHIDTTQLEELVQFYESINEEHNKIFFGDSPSERIDGKAALYEETMGKISEIASMPAAVIGQAVAEGEVFTLNYVHGKGTLLQNAYLSAGETYEALMTAPRKDLGDSIKTAFRNVDDILEDMSLEVNDSNRRAVRILGYNQMDISPENIDAVKRADEELNRVLNKLTPAATVQMIRDGINPLETDMTVMEEYLSGLDSDILKEGEQYAKYLYKLEQNKEISQEEKEAYMGIYRLLRQVEKSDGAVLGSLVKQGAKISFQNLLSAVRSNKKTGMNITVDESFGGVEGSIQNGKSISEQINTINQISYEKSMDSKIRYEENLVKDILDQLREKSDLSEWKEPVNAIHTAEEITETSNKAMNQGVTGTTLEQLLSIFRENPDFSKDGSENHMERQYQSQQLQEFRQISQIEESVIQSLIDFDQPITMNNLLAANVLQHNRGNTYRKLYEDASATEKEQLEQAFQALQDSFSQGEDTEAVGDKSSHETQRDEIEKSYQTLQSIAEEALESKMEENQVTSIDIKSAALTFKQISLMRNLAKEENYEVPVRIGDEITSINLRIIRGSDSSKVTATTQTSLYGKVAAEFTATPTSISGYLATDSMEGYENLKELEAELIQKMDLLKGPLAEEKPGISVQTVYSKDLDINRYQERSKETVEEEKVSSRELYGIAKSVISTLQTGSISR